MDLTTSYTEHFPPETIARYSWIEVRNAAAVMRASNPAAFADVATVLATFVVDEQRDVLKAGGNETDTAALLNGLFRDRGWRETSSTVRVSSQLIRWPHPKGSGAPDVLESVIDSESYKIDNVKDRVALDVEWHAKDGNLDRDISAYRSFYDSGIIDCAAMITTDRASMRAWAVRLDPTTTKFKTSTTTSIEKATPRLTRGDGGGCPILIVGVSDRTISTPI